MRESHLLTFSSHDAVALSYRHWPALLPVETTKRRAVVSSIEDMSIRVDWPTSLMNSTFLTVISSPGMRAGTVCRLALAETARASQGACEMCKRSLNTSARPTTSTRRT